MLSLTRVFRQKEDHFVRILETMRKGRIAVEDIAVLNACDRRVIYDDAIEPVGLYGYHNVLRIVADGFSYPSKAEVSNINNGRLTALKTPAQVFISYDQPGINSKDFVLDQAQATEVLDRNTIWVRELSLKVGAMVMLVTVSNDVHSAKLTNLSLLLAQNMNVSGLTHSSTCLMPIRMVRSSTDQLVRPHPCQIEDVHMYTQGLSSTS